MDLRRLRSGEVVVAASGLVLLVSLFLPWYSITRFPTADANAWQALGVIDVLLFVLALGALAVVPATAGPRTPSLAIAYQALLCLGAMAGSILALFRLLSTPEDGLSREIGCYVGTLASLGVLSGCLAALRDERASSPGQLTDSTGVPVQSPAPVESVPVPRP